jgi:hypothetical protein
MSSKAISKVDPSATLAFCIKDNEPGESTRDEKTHITRYPLSIHFPCTHKIILNRSFLSMFLNSPRRLLYCQPYWWHIVDAADFDGIFNKTEFPAVALTISLLRMKSSFCTTPLLCCTKQDVRCHNLRCRLERLVPIHLP